MKIEIFSLVFGKEDGTVTITFTDDGSSYEGIWKLKDEKTLWYTVPGWNDYTLEFNKDGYKEAILLNSSSSLRSTSKMLVKDPKVKKTIKTVFAPET